MINSVALPSAGAKTNPSLTWSPLAAPTLLFFTRRIPSEMEVAPRYELLTLLNTAYTIYTIPTLFSLISLITLFALFKLKIARTEN